MTRLNWFKAAFAAFILTIAPLSSLAAEAVENTSEQVIQLDINVADAVTIAAALNS